MMRSLRIASLLSLAAAATALAQGPESRRPGGTPPAAEMLLSNVGQLELTDAQVVRLAAIARRSEARRRAMRGAMDSAQMRFGQPGQPGDSVARQQFRQRMQGEMRRAEEQMRTDQRDAIAVLTPDQQARAWNMVANRGVGARGVRRAPGMGPGPGRGRMGERMGSRPGPGARTRVRPPGDDRGSRMRGDELAPRLRREPMRRPVE